jgi:hypothetical protein
MIFKQGNHYEQHLLLSLIHHHLSSLSKSHPQDRQASDAIIAHYPDYRYPPLSVSPMNDAQGLLLPTGTWNVHLP